MLLHTVNKSPFSTNSLDSCLSHAQDGSGILLLEDGVYGAVQGTQFSSKVEDALKSKKVYALGPDLKARGVNDKLVEGVEVIDYARFVDLTTEFSGVESWL